MLFKSRDHLPISRLNWIFSSSASRVHINSRMSQVQLRFRRNSRTTVQLLCITNNLQTIYYRVPLFICWYCLIPWSSTINLQRKIEITSPSDTRRTSGWLQIEVLIRPNLFVQKYFSRCYFSPPKILFPREDLVLKTENLANLEAVHLITDQWCLISLRG